MEFLIAQQSDIIPVEVKSGWVTQSKSLKVYMDRYKPPYAYVLSAKNVMHKNKYRYLPLYMAGCLIKNINIESKGSF